MLSFLLSLAAESDHDKIVYLYKRFHDDMIRIAQRQLCLASVADFESRAEDVVQNTFVKLTMYVKSIHFDVSENVLRAYVFSIVSNEVLNELKDQEDFDSFDDFVNTVSDENFVNDLMIRERYREVVAAIEQLDEKYRLALVYRFYKEYSVKQMAKLFGVPEKTVYTRISRAQKMLKKLLGEENNV